MMDFKKFAMPLTILEDVDRDDHLLEKVPVCNFQCLTPLNFDEILVQDFDDDYHMEQDNTVEILNKAKTLVNTYHNVYEYNNAMEIYNNYMEYLYDKYGGKRIVTGLKTCNLLNDFVPPKPKLKRTGSVRKLLNHGVFNGDFIDNLSTKGVRDLLNTAYKVSDETLLEVISATEKDLSYNDILDIRYDDNDFESLIQCITDKHNSSGDSEGRVQFENAIEYFSKKNDCEEYYDASKPKRPTLRQRLNPNFDEDEWNKKQRKDRTMRVYDGKTLSPKQYEQMQIKKLIFDNFGIDVDNDDSDIGKKRAEQEADNSTIAHLNDKDGSGKKPKRKSKKSKYEDSDVKEVADEVCDTINDLIASNIQEVTGKRFSTIKDYADYACDPDEAVEYIRNITISKYKNL